MKPLFRDSPLPRYAQVADVLLRLSCLADDLPDVAELDLNPIIAGPEGCVAVDWRIRVRSAPDPLHTKTW